MSLSRAKAVHVPHERSSFIVVGPDGEIEWRADYGGTPDYTMYVPVPNLFADIREGKNAS